MKIFFTKNRQWQVDVTIAGRRVREHGFGKKTDAEDFVIELKDQARREKHRLAVDQAPVSLERLIAERISDTAKQAGARQVKRILNSFGEAFPEGFLISDVTGGHVRDWARQFKRANLKAQTINRYLNIVGAMFNKAHVFFSEVDENWRGPKIEREPVSQRGRERIIRADEITTLLQELRLPGTTTRGRRQTPQTVTARREVADCLELALNTGMRGKEVRCLEWSDVDLQECEIHLRASKTKTDDPRDVMLNRRALEILRRRWKVKTGPFVFPNPTGTRPRTEISNVVRPTARRLGLRYGRDLADGFSPHDTRHTATTIMLRRGHDIKTVQDVLGHSDRTMTLRYTHSTRASRRAAVEDLAAPLRKVENSRNRARKSERDRE